MAQKFMKKPPSMFKKYALSIFKYPISLVQNNETLKKYLMPILIVASIILGCSAGLIFGEKALTLNIFPKIFMWFIKNLTPYLIFFAISSGILSIGSLEQLKRLGLKAGGIYMITAVFAVIIGITSGLVFHPGVGFQVPNTNQGTSLIKIPNSNGGEILQHIHDKETGKIDIKETGFIDTLLSSPLLSLVVMTLLLAIAVLAVKDYYEKREIIANNKNNNSHLMTPKEKTDNERNLLEAITVIKKIDLLMSVIIGGAKVIFKAIGWIIWLAPLAVFGAMANLFATPDGINALDNYGTLLSAFLTSVAFQFIVLAILLVVIGRLNPLPFFQKIWPVQMMAFSTSSSKATLPFAMEELQDKLGASERGAKFILPLGATINMDGTAIYLGLCGVFFAQAYGIDLSLSQYLILGFTCTAGSIGAAGLPGGSMIFMPMTLAAAGIPIDGIPVIIAIDRILDMVRTMTNITGDCALALAIDASENNINREHYNKI